MKSYSVPTVEMTHPKGKRCIVNAHEVEALESKGYKRAGEHDRQVSASKKKTSSKRKSGGSDADSSD